MVMPKSYDDAVSRKLLELRGEIKIPCVPIVEFPPEIFGEVKKKRGWPKGKKRGLKSP